MHVPCETDLHWRRITLVLGLEQDELDIKGLAQKLGGKDELDEVGLVLKDVPDCHSHVFFEWFAPPDEKKGKKQASRIMSVTIRTYRTGSEEESSFSHDAFFKALLDAAPKTKEFRVLSFVDLNYKVPPARWRIPLIANPPKFGDLESELGAITLAGLTLRFEKSPVGLHEVSLEGSLSGDEDMISLTYDSAATRKDMGEIYQEILKKAERFASLFVDVSTAKPTPVTE